MLMLRNAMTGSYSTWYHVFTYIHPSRLRRHAFAILQKSLLFNMLLAEIYEDQCRKPRYFPPMPHSVRSVGATEGPINFLK